MTRDALHTNGRVLTVKIKLRLAAVLAVVVVLGACSGDAMAPDHSDDQLLAVYLPWSDPEVEDRLEREFHARVEDIIAECMHDGGLEYVPVALEAVSYGPGTGISRSEHSRRFGFGISTNDQQFAAFEASTASVGDPNFEYEESLSTERAIVYSEERGRCTEQAHRMAPHPPDQFKRAVDDLVNRVRADPEVIEAEAEWVACVRSVSTELPRFSSLDQLTSWFWEESERVKDRSDELVRLQDLEREVAVRHLECEPSLLTVMGEVGAKYQAEVAADYSDLFDRQREFLDS
jgi:hypothetical protein